MRLLRSPKKSSFMLQHILSQTPLKNPPHPCLFLSELLFLLGWFDPLWSPFAPLLCIPRRINSAAVPVTGSKRSSLAASVFPIRGAGLKIHCLPVVWGEPEHLFEGSDVGNRTETFSRLTIKGNTCQTKVKTQLWAALNCVDLYLLRFFSPRQTECRCLTPLSPTLKSFGCACLRLGCVAILGLTQNAACHVAVTVTVACVTAAACQDDYVPKQEPPGANRPTNDAGALRCTLSPLKETYFSLFNPFFFWDSYLQRGTLFWAELLPAVGGLHWGHFEQRNVLLYEVISASAGRCAVLGSTWQLQLRVVQKQRDFHFFIFANI